jgi:hypothetical protein
MGDRCYVSITVRRSDLQKWLDQGWEFEFEEDDDKPAPTLCFLEKNYGMHDTDYLPGCPMYGFSGEGGTYPAYVFATDGEDVWVCEAVGDEPVVKWGKDGAVQEDVAEVMEYWKALERVKAMLNPEELKEKTNED